MKPNKPTTGATPKTGQDVHPEHASEPPPPKAETYWTLWRGDADDAELRRAWNIPARARQPLPHECLCRFGFDSPLKMLAYLVGVGWGKEEFDKSLNRFALIEASAGGITVTPFETFAAACKAHALSAR